MDVTSLIILGPKSYRIRASTASRGCDPDMARCFEPGWYGYYFYLNMSCQGHVLSSQALCRSFGPSPTDHLYYNMYDNKGYKNTGM